MTAARLSEAPARDAASLAAGRIARGRQAAAALLRQHWLAAILLAVGLVLRVLAELAYRPALFYIDSVKYISDAQGNDPEGYKAPLRAILLVGNFDTVAAVQHILGLAMAVVIYMLVLRRGASRWLAALAMAPMLLDGYQLQNEQTIMPGTWFEALIVAGLAILLWRPRPGWRAVIAAGLVLGTSAIVAQVGEALLVPAVIFLLVAGGGWRRVVARAGVLIVMFAVPIAAYSIVNGLVTGSYALSHQGATSLYGRAAAAVNCATIKLPADERRICPTAAQQAHGNDWLSFNPNSPVQAIYQDLPRGQVNSMVISFSKSVVAQQPLRVLDAYGRDVLKLYAVDRVTDPGDPPISRWQFERSFPYLTPHATKPEVEAKIAQFGGGTPTVWRPVAAFLHDYQLDGGYTPGPLLLLFTITGLAGSAVLLVRRRPAHVRERALACLLMTGSAVFLLLVSDLFVYSWRYQLPALVTLVPAGVLGLSVLSEVMGVTRRLTARQQARAGTATLGALPAESN
jgi:hypothetical protein